LKKKPVKRKYTNYSRWDKNQIFQRTSVDEDIKDILTSIALQNSSQIIFGKNIEGTETLSIESMPLEGAFNLILERNNLEYKWQGNTIIVSSIKETSVKKEFIILKELNVTKLRRLLKRYGLYDNLKNKITFDNEMNAIFVNAENELVEDLIALISQFEIAEKILKESLIAKAKHNIEYQKLKELEGKNIAFSNKKQKYGFGKYEQWQMKIEIIPLKYLVAGSKKVKFQDETIKVDSLEDTLKGLLGINTSKPANTNDEEKKKNINDETPFLKVDKRTNSVIIKDYPDRIEDIKAILKRIDKPAKLVEIEVTIATGTTSFTKQLGINLGGSRTDGNGQFGIATSEGVAESINNANVGDLLQPTNALGLTSSMLFTGSRSVLNFQLNAMEEDGVGKVISNPKIVTLDNKEAEITSGNDLYLPITTDDEIALEQVNTGILINTTPHIIEKKYKDDSDYIMLDIEIERSELGVVTTEKVEKSANRITSTVLLKNNQTLILGGLFHFEDSDSDSGVPLLKDIPFLDILFETTSKRLNKTELLFFITPRIITSELIKKQEKNKNSKKYKKVLEKEINNF
jgi:type II secretory pathway component GspD/PulD (secretin)